MPRKDAREALLATRSEPSLKDIPIVILTTSEEEWDIASTKKAGAESFIIKPATFKVWVEIVRSSGGMHSG